MSLLGHPLTESSPSSWDADIGSLCYRFGAAAQKDYPSLGFVSQAAPVVKNPLASAGDIRDAGSILGRKGPLEGAQQPTPVSLPGEPHGQRSLGGYSPWGCKEPDTTGHRLTHTCRVSFTRNHAEGNALALEAQRQMQLKSWLTVRWPVDTFTTIGIPERGDAHLAVFSEGETRPLCSAFRTVPGGHSSPGRGCSESECLNRANPVLGLGQLSHPEPVI